MCLTGEVTILAHVECLREGNALVALRMQGRRDCGATHHERQIDGVLNAFCGEFFLKIAGAGLDTRQPVFVFGLPRSGTTLVEQVLASHSGVHAAGEISLTGKSLAAIPRILGRAAPPLECVGDLEAQMIPPIAERHLDSLLALVGEPPVERIVDKMPDNYIHLGFLASLFPRATFIYCRRGYRDIAVSCWMTDFGRIGWASDFEHIAARICQHHRIMDHWRKVLPVPLHEFRYEETVADLEGASRKLLTACGLGWEPACLNFHQSRRPIRTASAVQVRQPVYRRSVGRWKNYERALAGLFERLPQDE